ncbi:complement C2 isoform 9-T10 [Spinachia spinachia]
MSGRFCGSCSAPARVSVPVRLHLHLRTFVVRLSSRTARRMPCMSRRITAIKVCAPASPQEFGYGDGTYEDSQPLNCSTTESIRGGRVTYSQGGLEGSVLTYHCGPGRYPFPASQRLCGADGDWSPMRLSGGRRVHRVTCRDVLCPAQLQLDHGDLWPRDQWSRVGATQSFSCQDGFTLHGSAQRNCTLSGEWTGRAPACVDQGHGQKTGTNLHAALNRVAEVISFLKQNGATNHFNETQNIIVIETDGYSNTGRKPQLALNQIRNLLGYSAASRDHTDETMLGVNIKFNALYQLYCVFYISAALLMLKKHHSLDVYVFGIGNQVNKGELNSLASQKRGENHFFVMKDFQTLGQLFNSIISDQSVTMCGVAREREDMEKTSHTRPWHVTLTTASKASPCVGSIVSPNWVLTAAHCFNRLSAGGPQQLHVQHGDGAVAAQKVFVHPSYNVRALEHRNVSEFYDYDVALVRLAKSVRLSWKARPICLPCTVPADRAMKRINSTCRQHRKELLPHKETAAFFIHKNDARQQTHVHTESQRPGCVEKARQTLREPTDVTLDEYIPDRFLCSGGSSGYQDAISCRGDSGGSLFLQKRNRYFQLGVLSWGTTNVCGSPGVRGYSSLRPPPDARDFHIDLFEVMPWLKQLLGGEVQFLPDVE